VYNAKLQTSHSGLEIFLIIHQYFIKEIRMLQPNKLSICISIILKYFIFYIMLMFINKEFKLLEFNNIKNGQDLFYYLWIVLFFPILDMILCVIPLYFSFKSKRLIFVISIFFILLIEYLLYAYFTSQKLIDRDAFLKVIINIFLLYVFFYKVIQLKFR
jgi:hypothetical protein